MLEKILNKPETYRKKAALGVTVGVFAVIFFSWAAYRGFVDFSGVISIGPKENQLAAATESMEAVSPFESVSKSFSRVFSELGNEYNALKSSLESVFVPFIGGIEVYDSR